ncbi:conserved Plasmodium protein, unknown function [Plasmodium vivax]|uniref:Uncharacterized protein n=6 Tax=Plasmodium vivax TaxID=5855 RepID=A5K5W5_PLAVS|nr:hypothetical protein, conserved [Plasmodium vivax]KMZ81889.1 hypothetical protein PVIIG_02938 [Plasmodium vivax India VII]KMZ88175.1 hypothetical protein PVBG_02636 [Plasmodium vivax Brazil I]KMZ94550.1 hypothetical protein PVMG_01907 [Plasmodium vivax Mauritania I]KNA01090.1 hypothetical protein PVNG_02543 [Plasmodium vivax North Korean]EDL45300.1 hypothetical protein, conserved [Plasmodium vivax]|eukprot:XP_001615027.1 hypothetical protein [Plasmodium vivax Sal-1]
MGNTVPYNCYERWGKRTPDGPLLNYDPQTPNNGSLATLLENFNYESAEETYNGSAKKGHTPSQVYQGGGTPNSSVNTNNRSYNNSANINSNASYNSNANYNSSANYNNTNHITPKVVRNARRRPTYSPTARKINLETEEEEEEDKLSTDNSDEHISAKDIKEEKIKQYRKTLTKVVKIKTAIFHETVKVTCSKDGKMLEWYKGKAEGDGKKKPIGSFSLNKITSVRTKVDNLKSLEIAVSSVNISTYLFIFKTREERESWQNNLESFRKIMSMK